jgi:hypothetical protein
MSETDSENLISASSLTKCATAFGRFSKEISFTSIMIVFNDYGANEKSVFAGFTDTGRTHRKHLKC